MSQSQGVVAVSSRTAARGPLQAFSQNIDRADMDLGQAFRENEFSENIDRADADLGAAMTAFSGDGGMVME